MVEIVPERLKSIKILREYMEVRDVVTTIVAVTVGVMLTASLLIPIAQEEMAELDAQGFGNWSNLVGMVVVVTLISLVVVALYAYTSKK